MKFCVNSWSWRVKFPVIVGRLKRRGSFFDPSTHHGESLDKGEVEVSTYGGHG